MTWRKTHGLSRTPIYTTWVNLVRRCRVKKCRGYRFYGAKGIDVCDEWANSFEAFYAHVGDKPSQSHTIDRINTLLGYEPGNVRWATSVEQNRNRRNNRMIEFDGMKKCLSHWAAEYNIKASTLHHRLKRGEEMPYALRPSLGRGYRAVKGITKEQP